jgi:2-polyprenyl-3-methyl-5-hydroxy-6-metoxy-1,4-benzoquinol methylase
MSSGPDSHSIGLAEPVNALRYDGHTDDPDEVAGILHSFMPSNAKILDVGCGTGSVSLIANRGKNNSVFGIEPDSARAEVARARGINATCGYLTVGYLAEHGPFDVIVFADVLEHLPNPADLLGLARSALVPGGHLLISVPNAVHWTMRWEILCGRFDHTPCGLRDATHLRWFTRASIVRLLNHAGFEVVTLRMSAGTDFPEYFAWWPWRWMGPRNRTPLVRMLAKLFPSLFGGQFLIKAVKR